MSTDRVERLPLTALRESPFNPRTIYPEAELQELAESIAAQGVMQPILVRVLPQGADDLYHQYEIIFGHRRFRAAALAGLEFIPSLIVEKTDLEAAIMQAHENMKRADVTAIEEAESFIKLNREHGLTPMQIAEVIGKSRSYVYGQMRLGRSSEELRTACIEQGLSAELAREVACQKPPIQRAALAAIRDKQHETPERPIVWMSSRDGKAALRRSFTEDLEDAEFDTTQADLLPLTGACDQCHMRAGNNSDLADMPPNTCLDMQCFRLKGEAHHRQHAEQLRAEGHTIISGEEARKLMPSVHSVPSGMFSLSHYAGYVLDEGSTEKTHKNLGMLVERAGPAAPALTYVVNPHTQKVEAFLSAEARQTVLEVAGLVTAKNSSDSAAGDDVDELDAEPVPLDEQAVGNYKTWSLVQQAISEAAAAQTVRTGEELKFVVLALLEDMGELPDLVINLMGWREEIDALEEACEGNGWCLQTNFAADQLESMSPEAIAKLMVLLALDKTPFTSGSAEGSSVMVAQKLRLAALYGVDPVAAAGLAPTEETARAEKAESDLFDIDTDDEADDTPSPQQAAKPSKNPVKYRDPATGMSWSGRGLQPKWLKVAIADGKRLEDFATDKPEPDAAQLALLGGQEEEAGEVSA